jgi:dihydrofolate reductase
MNDIKVSAIVAMAENYCIGQNNDLPWHIPGDLKRFKAITMGKPVIMGRKTFESILKALGKPFPGRTNIILSRTPLDRDDVLCFSDLNDAIDKAKHIARQDGQDEIIIGGGAQIYTLALDLCDKLYLTTVHTNVDGDAFFPNINADNWTISETESFDKSEEKHPPYTNKILYRKTS